MGTSGKKLEVSSFVDKRYKHLKSEIQATVNGAANRDQATKLQECLQNFDEITHHKEIIEQPII